MATMSTLIFLSSNRKTVPTTLYKKIPKDLIRQFYIDNRKNTHIYSISNRGENIEKYLLVYNLCAKSISLCINIGQFGKNK